MLYLHSSYDHQYPPLPPSLLRYICHSGEVQETPGREEGMNRITILSSVLSDVSKLIS